MLCDHTCRNCNVLVMPCAGNCVDIRAIGAYNYCLTVTVNEGLVYTRACVFDNRFSTWVKAVYFGYKCSLKLQSYITYVRLFVSIL